jgi:hypothetical protein
VPFSQSAFNRRTGSARRQSVSQEERCSRNDSKRE